VYKVVIDVPAALYERTYMVEAISAAQALREAVNACANVKTSVATTIEVAKHFQNGGVLIEAKPEPDLQGT
jgi:hypothetical protein